MVDEVGDFGRKERILLADYQETLKVFRMLADIRFRLLALLPVIAGAAIALLGTEPNVEAAAVGLVGLFATCGILMYEVRNTSLYDSCIRRAKRLEELLGMPAFVMGRRAGGLVRERPASKFQNLLFLRKRDHGLLQAKHDHGLALTYGATIGGWSYLVSSAVVRMAAHSEFAAWVTGLAVGFTAAVIVVCQLFRIDSLSEARDIPEGEPELTRPLGN